MHTPDYALLLSGGNQSLAFSSTYDLTMGTIGNNTVHPNGSDPFARNEEVAQIEIMVLSITFVVAVIGNVSVLLAMYNTKKKMSRMHLFIKHLSLADLVVAFFQVLPQLCWEITFRFYGPDFLCRIVKHLQVMGMFASTYMMVMMTLDRYIAICHPLKTLQQPTQRSYIMIISTWMCSLVLSTPQYFIFSLSEIKNGSDVYDCWAYFIEPWGAKAYITWITVGIFLVPVVILMMCYGFICHSIWKNIKYKKRKTMAGAANSENTAVTLSALLASLNSCCNPWIYMIFSGHLLQDFVHCFSWCHKMNTDFKKEDSDSSLRRTTLLTKMTNRSPTGSSGNWRELDNSPKSSIQAE
eukprot:superscaffoldBa00001408_g10403